MLNDRQWLHSPGLAKRFALVRIFKNVLHLTKGEKCKIETRRRLQ